MKVAILKYNAGNIRSVSYALNRLGIKAQISDDAHVIRSADKVIFPGVGEAYSTMTYLKARKLDSLLKSLTQPVLGICLGLQLMCSHSEEGDTGCIDLFDVKVKKFPPKNKVPHMGWNAVKNLKGDLFKGIPEDSYVYFVHSYYAEKSPATIADCNYILPFTAAINKKNFFATQFHPEKSGLVGQQILKNFIEL